MLFLEVAILPFATRLSVPDIIDIKKDIQGRIVHVNTDEDPSGWRPCFTFLETLEEKCLKKRGVTRYTCDDPSVTDDKEAARVRRRDGQKNGRRQSELKRLFDEQSGSDEDESISGGSDREDKLDEDDPRIETIRSAARRRAPRGERSKGQ
ncbi:unnamed protein product [Arabidopsis halleri]